MNVVNEIDNKYPNGNPNIQVVSCVQVKGSDDINTCANVIYVVNRCFTKQNLNEYTYKGYNIGVTLTGKNFHAYRVNPNMPQALIMDNIKFYFEYYKSVVPTNLVYFKNIQRQSPDYARIFNELYYGKKHIPYNTWMPNMYATIDYKTLGKELVDELDLDVENDNNLDIDGSQEQYSVNMSFWREELLK
jgi:hypothetical protein